MSKVNLRINDKMLIALTTPKRVKIFVGGRGCIHRGTLIDTPDGKVRVSDFQGGVIYSYDGDKVVSSYAGKPIVYPKEQLYKLTDSNGNEIICTAQHRFLTDAGWLPLSSLRRSTRLLSASYHPQSTSGTSLSGLHADVRRCSGTLLNFLYHYYECLCQYGLRPLRESDTYLDLALLLADEQQHIRHAWTCSDDLEFANTGNLSPLLCRLSSLASLLEEEVQSYGASGSCSIETASELILQCRQLSRQSQQNINLQQLAQLSSELFLCFGNLCQSSGQIHQIISGILSSCVHGDSFSASFSCNGDHHYASIESISHHSFDNYYDLFVPVYNNYLSCGLINHNSGKSIGVGDIMIMLADRGERICCAREFQNSIDDSVHESLKDELDRLGVDGFTVQAKEIFSASGGNIFYKGLARNITSLKSLAGVNRLWIEEGESVSEKSLKVLTPSIRSTASANNDDADPPEIWITMNRASANDAIAKKYLARAEKELMRCGYYEDDLLMVIQLNYQDNPWFPPELEQERLDDEKNLTGAEYRHIWGGEYYDEVEDSIIPVEWFNAAIDAHKKLRFEAVGPRIVSHDPSDKGPDSKGLCLRQGSVILDVQEKIDGDVAEGCDWATSYAHENRADVFVWDCDGMGVALAEKVHNALHGTRIKMEMFKGSHKADNPDEPYLNVGASFESTSTKSNAQTFRNKRAQYYWKLRDRFYATFRAIERNEYMDPDSFISISSDIECIDQLRAEICRIPRKQNPNGMIQIMNKVEMSARHGIASPNMADALMMAMIDSVADDDFLDDLEYPDQGMI